VTRGDETWVAQRIGLESSGKIIVAGVTSRGMGTAASAGVVRLTADGRLDDSYGAAGYQIVSDANGTPIGGGNVSTDWYNRVSLTIQPSDDKAVVGMNVDTTMTISGGVYGGGSYTVPAHQSYIARLTSDNRAPRAELQTKDLTISDPTTTTLDIKVTYTDETLIDQATLANANISITGPGITGAWRPSSFTYTVGDVQVGPNSDSFTVVYHIDIPVGFWGTAAAPVNNGTFLIQIRGTDSHVADTDGATVVNQNLGQFRVNIVPTAVHDILPPIAKVDNLPISSTGNTGVVVGGRTALDFTIRYEDQGGGQVSLASISSANIRVLGPNFYVAADPLAGIANSVSLTLIDVTRAPDSLTDDRALIAHYRIAAPGGTWDVTDNGQYQIMMQTGQVCDNYGGAPNFVPAGLVENFTVAITPGIDVRPTAQLRTLAGATVTPASPLVFNAATGFYEFRVIYTASALAGNVAMDPVAIMNAASAIRVQCAPLGYDVYAKPMGLQQVNAGDPTSYTVVYRIVPPAGGLWTTASNGIYTVSVVGNQIPDTDQPANFVKAGNLGTFSIGVGQASTTGITATLVTPPQVSAGSNRVTFVVKYTSGVNLPSSIDGLPIFHITGPNYGKDAGAYVYEDTPSFGKQRIDDKNWLVTYIVLMPDGTDVWNSMANGVYTIRTVVDTGVVGLAGDQLIGTFRVRLAAAVLVGSELQVAGTTAADTIDVSLLNGKIHAIVNGTAFDFQASSVSTISVRPGDGNDTVRVRVARDTTVLSGSGNDTILTSSGNDYIDAGSGRDYVTAGAGNDEVHGGLGQDTLLGQAGNDELLGEGGADSLLGAAGADVLHGGAAGDILNGGRGVDILFGDDGNDWLYSRDSEVDSLYGGAGVNHAQTDKAPFSVIDDLIPNDDIQDLLV
jgi:RTX calcium-binding nonapeptide repeat (4 copies)/Domain of unknown function (DUF5122) beta-propeller